MFPMINALKIITAIVVACTGMAQSQEVCEPWTCSEGIHDKEVHGPAEYAFGPKDSPIGPFDVRATAYDSCRLCTGKEPGHPAFGITKTGTHATAGRTVAVDPDFIPLGSTVYIEGLGLRRAEDTGGLIKGPRVDVFMNCHEEALEFGVRHIRLWLVDGIHSL